MPRASARVLRIERKVNGGRARFDRDMKRAQAGGGLKVKVGLPKGSGEYPDGTPVLKVGIIHEFGSEDGTIPERSWLRSAVKAHRRDYRRLIRKLAKAVSSGKRDPVTALELLGTKVADDVRAQIVAVKSPPNKPATIKAKGSSNPLVDTGLLGQSVTHKVIGKKK